MSKALTLFDHFWSDVPSVFSRGFFDSADSLGKFLDGRCDMEETDEMYRIDMELPGVKKKEVDITFKDDRLTISWSRYREKKTGLRKNTRFERQEGSFSRSFVTRGVDSEKIDASLKNGVLTIELPKLIDYRAKNIQIK